MAKGYWIARVDVHNMDGYKEYVAQNGAVFAKYGARFLVRGGKHVPKEGSSRSRNVVLEFKDYETALACYNSPEYVRNATFNDRHCEPTGRANARPMTGSAKQSIGVPGGGLYCFGRCAPRNGGREVQFCGGVLSKPHAHKPGHDKWHGLIGCRNCRPRVYGKGW